jgi:hypothetical protein
MADGRWLASSTDGARRMRMAKLGGSVSPSGESRRVRTRIQLSRTLLGDLKKKYPTATALPVRLGSPLAQA